MSLKYEPAAGNQVSDDAGLALEAAWTPSGGRTLFLFITLEPRVE